MNTQIEQLQSQLQQARELADGIVKSAFQAAPAPMPVDPNTGQPMDPSMMGGQPPMDPAMAGGQPPMDPAMMGGQPPMDPAMAGGQPPIDPNTGQPMDPSMMGGAPPAPADIPDELVQAIEEMGSAIESISGQLEQLQQASDEFTKQGKDHERRLMKLEVALKGPNGAGE